MAPVRRAAVAPAPPPVVEGVNFGALNFYSGGFTLPKGKYAIEFDVRMHQATNQGGQALGAPRLGVMMTCHPLEGGEIHEQFMSMGSKADKSFAPNPETGKGVIAVPGGPASSMPNSTNWALWLKSMYDCGMPVGVFTNDFSTIDAIWVQTDQVPEPEDRKGFGSQAATGEASEEKRQGSGMVPIVVEILEGGKPWEGGGGIPTAAAAPVAAPVKAGPKAAVAPKAGPKAAPAPVVEAEATDDDVMSAATSGITTVLEANPNGCSKLLLRTGTFKAVTAAAGPDVAQAVIDTYFGSDEALNSVLGQLGYSIVGTSVKPA